MLSYLLYLFGVSNISYFGKLIVILFLGVLIQFFFKVSHSLVGETDINNHLYTYVITICYRYYEGKAQGFCCGGGAGIIYTEEWLLLRKRSINLDLKNK